MIWKCKEKYLFLPDFKPYEKTPVALYQIYTNSPLSVLPRLVKSVFLYIHPCLLYCVYPTKFGWIDAIEQWTKRV
jgi:hypothetical protein